MKGNATIAYLLPLIIFLFAVQSQAQNLVLNRSFEDYSLCPDNSNQLDRCDNWTRPTSADSDYFNACATSAVGVPGNGWGWQAASDGNAYAGLVTWVDPVLGTAYANYREYLTSILQTPLDSGEWYTVSFKVNKAEQFRYASDHIGVYFSDTGILIPGWTYYPNLSLPPYNVEPQVSISGSTLNDTAGWTEITQDFQADGGERFLTLGSFISDSETISDTDVPWASTLMAYYFIDEVSVELKLFAPNLEDDSATVETGESIEIDVLANDTDPDGGLDVATLGLVSLPASGIAIADEAVGEITYSAPPGFVGIDTFNYTVCDDDGLCGEAQVVVTVTESGMQPFGLDDYLEVIAGESLSIDVAANDFP